MKKILILLICISSFFILNNNTIASYTVIDNTQDWVHNHMSSTLVDLGTRYLNGELSPDKAWEMLSNYVTGITWWTAQASAHFDSNGALHVWCSNNWSLVVFKPIWSSWSQTAASYEPPPVTCSNSSYITYSYWNWSACNVGINTWSTPNTISCTQTRSITPQNNPCQVCSDGSSSCYGNEIPGSSSQDSTLSFNFWSLTYSGEAFADNNSKITITIPIDAPKEGINWNGRTFGNFQDTTIIKSNRIDNTWDMALSLSWKIAWNWNNQLIIDVISIAPVNTHQGKISFKEWNKTFNIDNINYNFKKPFIWQIQVWDEVNNNWNGTTTLWTENKYKLWLLQKSPSLSINSLSWYTLNDFSNEIQTYWDEIEIQSKTVDTATLDSKTGTEFTARINTSEDATELNQTPWLQINLPIVEYTLDGKTVKYYLSEQDDWNDTTPIKTTGSDFMWVRVIGGIQWAGKSEFTWQEANISNLYNSEQRMLIRKAAYEYVKNMNSWDFIDGVKYVNWDIKMSDITENFETLVIVNGNLILDTNMIQTSLRWIIVLKDWYSVDSDFSNSGNIYITSNVTQINAIIYADGGIISTNASETPYTDDSTQRTQDLKNQLILNGSVFTRNTIWGAILAWGDYILPGGTKTLDFNKAMIYDLNYIRRGNSWCDKNENNNCTDAWEYKDPFVIIYDSRIQIQPPKLFSK